jgi:uncharacterized membrane protein
MDLVADLIFAVGSVICHQRPDRSFFLDGQQLPVCARCTGLYLSGAIGLLAWLIWRRWKLAPGSASGLAVDPRAAKIAFVLAAMPTALSLAAGALGVWDGSNVTRAVLAIPLGASAGAIVAAVAAKDLR